MKQQLMPPPQWNVASNPSKTNSRLPWERPQIGKKIEGQWEEITSGDPEEVGHPCCPQENYCPPCPPQCSRCKQQRFCARQRKEESLGRQSLILWEEGHQAHQLAQIDNLVTTEIQENYGFIPNTNISTHLNARHVLGNTPMESTSPTLQINTSMT
jgi:hypothetical protein